MPRTRPGHSVMQRSSSYIGLQPHPGLAADGTSGGVWAVLPERQPVAGLTLTM